MREKLSEVEAMLTKMAVEKREATIEAANSAFNHAIGPILRARGAATDPSPVIRVEADGVYLEYIEHAEQQRAAPVEGRGPSLRRVRRARREESEAGSSNHVEREA